MDNIKNSLDNLVIQLDTAGCPNRCRHCWLGNHRNGRFGVDDFKEIAEQFKNWRDENGNGLKNTAFRSWWREPDFSDDYRELWDMEKKLSSPGRAERFELLSVWRLARDPDYAKWAASLPTKVCQLTFFGLEENTDWFIRRKGAFNDLITATERCIDAGISPRWQLFLTKKCMKELDGFLYLMEYLDLKNRCEKRGEKFVFFIGGMSPDGNAYELEDYRIEEDDVELIPKKMSDMSRDNISLLGKAEYKLLPELLKSDKPPHLYDPGALDIDADCNVYTAITEHTAPWKLGNLRIDGVDKILRAYRDCKTPGLIANKTMPVSSLAERYGDKNGRKLYVKDDLITKYLHQWGNDLCISDNDNLITR